MWVIWDRMLPRRMRISNHAPNGVVNVWSRECRVYEGGVGRLELDVLWCGSERHILRNGKYGKQKG